MKCRFILLLAACCLLLTAAFAADLNYPYGNINLKFSPTEDPFPGFGDYYSALDRGLKTVLWNPASLGKLKLSETSFAVISPLPAYNYQKTSKLTESSSTAEGGLSYALLYRYPADAGSGITTQEINLISRVNYTSSTSGLNFSAALKVNDWLAIGCTSTSPVGADFDLAGDFPLTARATTNLTGQSLGNNMQIGDAASGKLNKLTYTFTGGGIVTTYESTRALWGGFVSQEATLPLTNLTEIRNNLNFDLPFMGTIASKFGNLSLGLNLIPISATYNINNDVRTVINSDTEDMILYVPDFDPNNQSDLASWINDPDQYGNQAGYARKQIRLPAGEVVGTAKYRGFYTASTARTDFGLTYDLNDWFTVGLALENMSGSALNFKGEGIASYLNYRDISTAEVSNLSNLLEPGSKASFDLFTNRWITTTEVGSTTLFLEPEKNYALPKRTRYGFALKKPWLIAVDFEQNQTPIKYVTTTSGQAQEVAISNISLIRIGGETRVFAFPMWLRGGLTIMTKPEITGLTTSEAKSVNDYFSKYYVLPLKFDFGSDNNLWGTILDTSFGIDAYSLINVVQVDAVNLDFSKLVYYNVGLERGPWRLNYFAMFDPISTGLAYSSKVVPAGTTKKFELSDAKFIQTMGVTYKF